MPHFRSPGYSDLAQNDTFVMLGSRREQDAPSKLGRLCFVLSFLTFTETSINFQRIPNINITKNKPCLGALACSVPGCYFDRPAFHFQRYTAGHVHCVYSSDVSMAFSSLKKAIRSRCVLCRLTSKEKYEVQISVQVQIFLLYLNYNSSRHKLQACQFDFKISE